MQLIGWLKYRRNISKEDRGEQELLTCGDNFYFHLLSSLNVEWFLPSLTADSLCTFTSFFWQRWLAPSLPEAACKCTQGM